MLLGASPHDAQVIRTVIAEAHRERADHDRAYIKTLAAHVGRAVARALSGKS